MTIDEKYKYVLLALGEQLKKKEEEIYFLELDIRNLKEQLKAAERLLQTEDSRPLQEGGKNDAESLPY